MFETLLSKAPTWLSQRFEDSPLPGDLTMAEVDERVGELERQLEEQRDSLRALREEHRTVAKRAATSEGFELAEVRVEIRSVIQRYLARRKAFEKTHTALRFLKQVSLTVREPECDVDLGSLSTGPQLPHQGPGENVGPEGLRERGPGARDVHFGDIPTDSWVDGFVEQVVTAVQNDEPVPNLEELIDGVEENARLDEDDDSVYRAVARERSESGDD